jgi:hypothetical protein
MRWPASERSEPQRDNEVVLCRLATLHLLPRKRLPGAGDGCTADHCQPCLRLVAELAPIADHGAGDRGICNGPSGPFPYNPNRDRLSTKQLQGMTDETAFSG